MRAVIGKLSVLGSDGRIVDGGSGQPVELVAIDPQGQIGASIAATRTAADGSFRLNLPQGQEIGSGLAVIASDGGAGRWRALVLQTSVDLGPASEAFSREFIDARTAHATAFREPADRMARLQHNATLMLRLMTASGTNAESAVNNLREWLLADPAASAALWSLRISGVLPATLGDIGGLAGAARGAWDALDTLDGRHTMSIVPVAGTSNDWDTADTVAGEAAGQASRIRIEADAITSVFTSTQDPTSQVLLELIGQHKVASFSLDAGATQQLTSIQRATTGYDFDGDNREDQLRFQIEQTSRGVESIAVFGTTMQALRIDTRTELTVTMSGGGKTLSVIETRSRWAIPFAGPVRADSTVVANDSQGNSTTRTSQRIAERAVLNDVSWPGRLRLSAVDLHEPTNYMFTVPLGVTSDLFLTFGGFLPAPCCILDNGLSARDLTTGAPASDRVIAHSTQGTRIFASPDGTRLYAALSNSLPPGSLGGVYAMDPAQAATLGATVIRYDARTLLEEARIVLPPRPSTLRPGLAFPRNNVFQIVVSPTDSTQFVVSGFDALLVRDTTVATQTLGVASAEQLGQNGNVGILDNQVTLRGWDAIHNELWLELYGGGPLGRIAPIGADGLRLETLRDGPPVLFTLIGSVGLAVYDRISADRGYLEGHKTVIDTASGAVIRRLSDSTDLALQAARCAASGELIVCSNGDALLRFNKDLTELPRVPVQNDLRALARGVVSSAPQEPVFAPLDGNLVYLGYNLYNAGQNSNPRVALRLRY